MGTNVTVPVWQTVGYSPVKGSTLQGFAESLEGRSSTRAC